MMIKTTFVLLTLPLLAAAKMRGSVQEVDEIFPGRQLMENMDGGDNGGGSMNSGGCPSIGDAPAILCSSNEDCLGTPYCAGRDDCCCVSYTYSYCGVPSDCNPFLQCLPPSTPPMPVVFDATATRNAFALLRTLSECLVGDDEPEEPMFDSEDMPPMEEDDDDEKFFKGGKASKGMKKSVKSSKSSKSGKASKKSKSASSAGKSKLYMSEDYRQ